MDPSGLNAAGAGAGGAIGTWVGGTVGEFIDPVGGGVPGAAIGRGIGMVLGDWLTGPEGQILARLPLDVGGEEFGRRRGCGAAAGRRAAHAVKNSDPVARPQDDYTIDPDTGDVYDPNGDWGGNAGDYLPRR